MIRGCGMLPPLPVRPGNHRARPLQRTLPGITGVTTASITRAVQKTDSLVRWMTMHRMKRCPPSNNGTNGTMSPSSAPLLRSAARPSKAIMSWVPRQWPMSLRSRAILNVARYASGRRLLDHGAYHRNFLQPENKSPLKHVSGIPCHCMLRPKTSVRWRDARAPSPLRGISANLGRHPGENRGPESLNSPGYRLPPV